MVKGDVTDGDESEFNYGRNVTSNNGDKGALERLHLVLVVNYTDTFQLMNFERDVEMISVDALV